MTAGVYPRVDWGVRPIRIKKMILCEIKDGQA
jgi:hypothetical protein